MARDLPNTNPVLIDDNGTLRRVTIVSTIGRNGEAYIPVSFGDSGSVDAFGRARTSGTGQRLDAEFIYDKQEELFDELTTNGTVTFNGNTRDLTLSIDDANNGTLAKMASYPVPYTPGNSQLIDITGVLDLSGIGGGNAEVFLRSSISGTVTEEVINQDDWEKESGATDVDWTKSHILAMDFQSLKVGRIRYFLSKNGVPVKIAEITNDNKRDSGYWQLPNLPAYWKLYNDATYTYCEMGYGDDANGIGLRYKINANSNATMKAICVTVKSEGGLNFDDIKGLARSIDNNVTAKTVSTTLIPLLSIRPKATFKTYDNLGIAFPRAFSIATNNPIRLVVLHDATLTGASWADVDTPESMMEYDMSATALATPGHVIFSDYIATTNNSATSANNVLGKTLLWNRKDGNSGILTIAAVRTGSSNASVLSSMRWSEIR